LRCVAHCVYNASMKRTRTVTLNLRLATHERKLMEQAAKKAHLQVGTWMRQTCLRAAEREAGGDERRARLLDFIQRAREGRVAPAQQHAAEVEQARGTEWKR
jgi:uncharacterized protein (DUF1778 family)